MLLNYLYASLAALAVLPAGALSKSVNQHSAQDVISQLKLVANPEKGYYAQTFEDPDRVNNRSVSTLIYYLLEGKDGDSRWHRVTDAAEVWHYYAGAPLTLSLSSNDGKPIEKHVLGQEIFDGQEPQVVILKDLWQSARSHGSWTLVGTTVAPGFSTNGYEIAPDGWKPAGCKSGKAATTQS